MIYRTVIYLLFFLSGSSALIYQVLWVRSFSLIFGGSHMAVTTVLSVFMGGLALGGYLGKYTDRHSRPLKIYALLEIGIGVAAILLLGVLKIYPDIYVAFARLIGNDLSLLAMGRLLFAIIALLIPTTLMGLTLPALAGFADRQRDSFGRYLSFLYGINTFGAVVGALSAGFVLLRFFTVHATYGLAIAISLLVGVLALLLDKQIVSQDSTPVQQKATPAVENTALSETERSPATVRMILFGIGLSGFCALGYEILWTRVLSIVVGTTVYGYTLMLVAFLVGLAGGGASYRLVSKWAGKKNFRPVILFGVVQVVIGCSALLVSYALRDLPNQAFAIEGLMKDWFSSASGVRQTTNFTLALLYMLVPAFFMGLAFPLAADIVSGAKDKIGKSVGETLTYNTVGAILGAAISGFLLIRWFGIERSLQFLSLINLGLGLMVCASLMRSRLATAIPVLATFAVIVTLAVNPSALRVWNMKYFAVFNHNARQVLASEEKLSDLLESSDVLYYAEGTTSTISVVKMKGANQSINVNGRTVASSSRKDRQCQYTLGHLPMLLHENPQKVWVLGMGTGMTAGATLVHPEVESVVIAELEQHVPPAARTFAAFNHNLLDDPKVEVVFNDGRNFLLTTEERYDVITADPIHPWSQGAAYLYTDEYYRLAASRLRPGGVMCQWLPIYELSPRDLQSVVKTFTNNFRYTYVWLTDYDAELVGSNEPIEIDVDKLQQRIESSPEVLSDLQQVNMGSAAEFLSYCIMGPAGSLAYGKDAPLNTDNNLYLEFSAPDSKGLAELIAINISSLASHREDISPYLSGESLPNVLGAEPSDFMQAVKFYDQAHQLHYQGKDRLSVYSLLMEKFASDYSWFAPGQFLLREYQTFRSRIPQLLNEVQLTFAADNAPMQITFSAVYMKISPERAKLLIVNNQAKKIYGSVYLDATADAMDRHIAQQSKLLLGKINSIYRQEKGQQGLPRADVVLSRIESLIDDFVPEPI